MPYAIGLNSGSSFDGVDAVLVELNVGDDGLPTPPRYVDGISLDWPEDVGKQVLSAFNNTLSIFDLTRLNYVVGAIFAEAAQTLMNKHGLTSLDVDVVGYDGQTVYQEPPEHELMRTLPAGTRPLEKWMSYGYACGLQIGEPGVVAALTDVRTVTQFRPVDHALGGTGAPLMQFLDYIAFRSAGRPIGTLNLGGISNIQIADADRSRMKAFDCGPGNVMIDHAMRRFFDKPYDADGATAAAGHVDEAMLNELLQHPFFARPIPRCAWRLDFGAEYADQTFDRYGHLDRQDIVATVTQFSANAIAKSFSDNVPASYEIDTLITSGGGVRNGALMQRIQDTLPEGIRVAVSDDYGLPFAYKEAIKFATLAFATVRGIGNNIPAASGAHRFGILGKLTAAPKDALLTAL